MDLGLDGKLVIVTGASRGIGFAVTQAFVHAGARVIAGARRSTPELDTLLAAGSRLVEVDLTDPAAPGRLVDAAGDRIDVLVNNVGNAPVRTQGFLEITDQEWQATIDLNLFAAIRTTRAVLPHMVAAGRGSIVTIASVNATLADPAVIDYSASKAALANFSKSISKEFGGRGIRANTISPGPVETDLWLGDHGVAATVAAQTGANPDDVVDNAAHDSVTGRFTRPSEVADLAVVLASARAGNVTGADFRIDGGLIPTW